MPVVSTERGDTLHAYFRNCDFPVPTESAGSIIAAQSQYTYVQLYTHVQHFTYTLFTYLPKLLFHISNKLYLKNRMS